MNPLHFVACDLGAESGRVMLGRLDASQLSLEEIHRFPNIPLRMGNSLRWDAPGIFRELKAGLAKIASSGIRPAGISVDSWGVDIVWIGAGQPMLGLPFVYRDDRNDKAFADALQKVPREEIFRHTGIQFMPFNTIFQLYADHRTSPKMLSIADVFLPVADYLNFLFSGAMAAEESLASTTQIYNPNRRAWSSELIERFGFLPSVFPRIVPSGTVLGNLCGSVCEETGLGEGTKVIASCSHDTASAVAAVPAAPGEDWAYLSSGTWSLIGVELDAPLISPAVLEQNFTNEGGFGGSTRFLKNMSGLWILQECRRSWEKSGGLAEYGDIARAAESSASLRSLIDPSDARFVKPGNMPAKIQAYCRETNQPVPETEGEVARCILESLALSYRIAIDTLESLTGRILTKLHIVGGGTKNRLLNQLSANATGRTVFAGPAEATAVGNILIQAISIGAVRDLNHLREIVRNSFDIREFTPEDSPEWQAALLRFKSLCEDKAAR